MENDVARLVFTHEPFDVVFAGDEAGGTSPKDVLSSGQVTEAEFLDFNRKWIDAVLAYLVDEGVLGPFIDWRGLPIVHASATALGLTPLDLVVWAKAHARSLPIPARLAPALQERRRLTRQQPLRCQARPPSHQLVDRS